MWRNAQPDRQLEYLQSLIITKVRKFCVCLKSLLLENQQQSLLYFSRSIEIYLFACPISDYLVSIILSSKINMIVFFYQKEDITIRFTLSGSSDITGHWNVYFLIYLFVYLFV
jgi:hypothetical protein